MSSGDPTPRYIPKVTFNETFESSISQKQQKFMIDRSLIKAIHQNNASFIISPQEEPNPQADSFNSLQIIERSIFETRRKYDLVRTETLKYEQSILKMEKDKEKLELENKKLVEFTEKGKKDFRKCEEQLQNITALMEDCLLKRDVRLSMEGRLKKDILVHKEKTFDLNIRLLKHKTHLRSIINQSSKTGDISKRCKTLLHEIQQTVIDRKVERQVKLNSGMSVLGKKKTIIDEADERERGLQKSMLAAMTDRLPEEKSLLKLWDVHHFLKCLLKSKMTALINQYSPLETVYNKIHQHTQINHVSELITRFLDRDRIYGELLQSISQAQKKIEIERQETKLLREEEEEVRRLCEMMEDEQKERSHKVHPGNVPIHQIQQYNDSLQQIDKFKHQLYSWCIRVLSGLNDVSRDKIKRRYPKSDLPRSIKDALASLSKFITSLSTQENPQAKIQNAFLSMKPTKDAILKGDAYYRNLRIKTMNNTPTDDLSDHDADYSNLSQIDYLQQSRKQVKKLGRRLKTQIKLKPVK